MDNAISNVDENGLPEMAWDSIAPIAEEANMHGENDYYIITHNYEYEIGDDSNINDLDTTSDENALSEAHKLSMMFSREAKKDIIINSEYRYCIRHLNAAQRKIIMFNHQWCKNYVRCFFIRCLQYGTNTPSYKVFLNGPGGTGKSHIIKLKHCDVIYFLQKQ